MPDEPDVMDIQVSVVCAVQMQPVPVVTATLPVPPVELKDSLPGKIE